MQNQIIESTIGTVPASQLISRQAGEAWLHGPHGPMRYQFTPADAGPPLLLLHGFGSMLEHWDGVLPLLAQAHPCYALDLYGFGYSAPLQHPDRRIWADQIAYLIRNELPEPPIIIGNSLGGMVGAQCAADHPHLVRGLVLVNSTGLPNTSQLYNGFERAAYQLVRIPLVGELLATILGRELGVRSFLYGLYYRRERITARLIATLSRAFDRPHLARLCLAVLRNYEALALDLQPGDVVTPTLILWGERDQGLPLRIAHRLRDQLFPDADLAIIARSGHCPFDETPEAFCDIVLPWIAKIGRSR